MFSLLVTLGSKLKRLTQNSSLTQGPVLSALLGISLPLLAVLQRNEDFPFSEARVHVELERSVRQGRRGDRLSVIRGRALEETFEDRPSVRRLGRRPGLRVHFG